MARCAGAYGCGLTHARVTEIKECQNQRRRALEAPVRGHELALGLPDRSTAPEGPSDGLPTGRQVEYAETLMVERPGHRCGSCSKRPTTKREMTAFISHLLNDVPPRPKDDVPEGRYALPTLDGHLAFYAIEKPTEGRWAGRVFVKLLVGSPGAWRKLRLNKTQSKDVLMRLAEGPVEAAAAFGFHFRSCGQCGSPLSLVQSRAAGYGRKCADNRDWPYPTKKEAITILARRGEVIENKEREDV